MGVLLRRRIAIHGPASFMIVGTIFDGWSQVSRAALHPAARMSGGRSRSVPQATRSHSLRSSFVMPVGAVRTRHEVSSVRNSSLVAGVKLVGNCVVWGTKDLDCRSGSASKAIRLASLKPLGSDMIASVE